MDYRVEAAGGLKPDDRGIEQFDRRQLPSGHECALPGRIDIGQCESLCGVHCFESLCLAAGPATGRPIRHA